MSAPAFTLEELLSWHDETARNWQGFFAAHPELLDRPCDVFNVGNVLGLVRHIFAVELRYAERLSGKLITPYEQVIAGPVDALFALHGESVATFRKLLADPHYDWTRVEEFMTVSAGLQRATVRKIFIHSQTHALRHWAQFATISRIGGYKPEFPGDIFLSKALA